MKTVKIISALLAALLTFACFAACAPAPEKGEKGGLRIVTTVFPAYDMVKNVAAGTPAETVFLLEKGVDLHSFQPTAEDIFKISSCDLFIYVGGSSDGWAKDALKETINKDLRSLTLLDAVGDAVKEEEALFGMQTEEEEEKEADEHVWLSLKNAGLITRRIADELSAISPEYKETYEKNAAEYIDKLSKLDEKYAAAINAAPLKTLLFADRYPFRYLADDYGLTCFAAFSGCSAETEASFETVTFLAKKADELDLPAVLTIEGSSRKLAETVVNSTKTKDQKILTLDSMQGTTGKDAENGATYLSVMEKNLSVLKDALGQE
ncbi:MAG: zinc ABC transporter substrate-binding protein [Clostridia bacterium]|nr:zinc ABC transporter substrate-binding protein [Clostridia bacterium]